MICSMQPLVVAFGFLLLVGKSLGELSIQPQEDALQEGFGGGAIDAGMLPDGVTEEYAEQMIQEAFGRLLTNMQEKRDAERRKRRRLLGHGDLVSWEDPGHECNSVLATIAAADLRVEVANGFGAQNIPQWQMMLIDVFVTSRIRHDIRVWKLCGRCSDFGPGDVGCREQDYGYDAMHSGLFIAPYDVDADSLLSTTLPVNIIAPAAGTVPSYVTFPCQDPQVLIAMYISSTTRAYSIMIDYLGFGESKEYYRGFLLKQSVITATIPLIWQAEHIVARDSNCSAAMGEDYVLFGYSEGGYGVVAIADALDRMGKRIIMLHAGGGPFRVSTTTMLDAVNKVQYDIDPGYQMTFFMALLGGGMSTTNKDASNYGQGQDFFSEQVREDLVHEARIALVDRSGIFSVIPFEDPFSAFNPDLVKLFLDGLANGEEAPCVTSVSNSTDKICQALREQDLVEVLEHASYPVKLCHSSTDQLVPYENCPDPAVNPNIHLNTMTGTHTGAAIPCAVHALVWYANPLNVRFYPVTPKTKHDGCMAKEEGRTAPCQSKVLKLLGNPFGMC